VIQIFSLLLDRAQQFCPAFSTAAVIKTWAGDRPRPANQPAPILGFLPATANRHDRSQSPASPAQVILATGHYRNGVLMAPVTAAIVRDLITTGDSSLPWQKFQLTLPLG
jgi:glycine oxidase